MKIQKLNLKLILPMLLMGATTQAARLQLSDNPLFLDQAVPPALAVTFDDSGSMAWGWMPDGILANRASFASPDFNRIYYNPTTVYTPPSRADGTSFPNSNYNAAKLDGFYTGSNMGSTLASTRDLRNNYKPVYVITPNYSDGSATVNRLNAKRPSSHEGFYYLWTGPNNPMNINTVGSVTDNNVYVLHRMNGESNAEKTNFANWYTYYNTRGKLARAALSIAFVSFGPDFKIAWQQLNHERFSSSSVDMDLFDGSHRDDFYDWLLHVPASGGTPFRRAYKDAGNIFKLSGNSGPYYDSDYGAELACQQNFHITLSDGYWNSAAGNSGNIDATDAVLPDGVNYPDNMPAFNYIRDNTGSTVADNAFKYWSEDLRPGLPNRVPRFIDDYTDHLGNTVAVASGSNWWDNTELYWNPQNDPANWQHMVNFNIGLGVSGTIERPNEQTPYIRNGRRVTNFSTLGTNAFSWPAVSGNTPTTIDDVFHASLNSRGKYFSAKTPDELAYALNQVISNIISRKGRASAGSISSNVVSDSSQTFKTGFDTSDWSGYVVAADLNADGTTGTINWDAGCYLTGGACGSLGGANVAQYITFDDREIYSYDSASGNKVDFTESDLTAAMKDLILDSGYITSLVNDGTIPSANTIVDVVIEYIRGDQSKELATGNGGFRDRTSILGDVINSSALLLRAPKESYDDSLWQENTAEYLDAHTDNSDPVNDFNNTDDGYNKFRMENLQRESVLLVGANDGMLHAFSSGVNNPQKPDPGKELWAFVPSAVLKGLSSLADPKYVHKTFVDAAPSVRDVYFNGDWRTVAVGGLRHGGKSFYALDFEDDPADKDFDVLWEFPQGVDNDMGYSYGQPIIVRAYDNATQSSKWVAFLPNGYDSVNNQSSMYAVDIETGNLLHKWETGLGNITTPNGMGSPVAADFVAYNSVNAEIYGSDIAADFVYAGDLYGNLYRFDVSDIFTSPGGVSAPDTLFNGNPNQPITIAPRIVAPNDQTEDVFVVFGTGKYIELPDRTVVGYPDQYMFGIRDRKVMPAQYTIGDARFQEQTINEVGDNRTLSDLAVNTTQSWKILLPTEGERLSNRIQLNSQTNTVFFTTTIPEGVDPCAPGGKSWIMALNATSGSSVGYGMFNGGADGVAVNDLVLGMNIVTDIGGNQGILIPDGSTDNGQSGGGADPQDINMLKWGRKSWHKIILD